MPKRQERAEAKGSLATDLAIAGAVVGSPFGPVGSVVGGVIGGTAGLIIADGELVLAIDMIAIPAFQAYMIQGNPATQVYIKAGETILPTGGNVQDVQEAIDELEETETPVKRTRAPGAGLPKKFAKMGFKKGWAAYKKTPAYKKKQSAKKKKSSKRGSKK